jgi:hypothetical protein
MERTSRDREEGVIGHGRDGDGDEGKRVERESKKERERKWDLATVVTVLAVKGLWAALRVTSGLALLGEARDWRRGSSLSSYFHNLTHAKTENKESTGRQPSMPLFLCRRLDLRVQLELGRIKDVWLVHEVSDMLSTSWTVLYLTAYPLSINVLKPLIFYPFRC